MKQLALDLPGFRSIPNPSGLDPKFFPSNKPILGVFLTEILNVIFYVVIFIAFYYLIWGAFQYMMAQGNKEELAKARARITWAIIGLIITLLAYSISQFIGNNFLPTKGGLPF